MGGEPRKPHRPIRPRGPRVHHLPIALGSRLPIVPVADRAPQLVGSLTIAPMARLGKAKIIVRPVSRRIALATAKDKATDRVVVNRRIGRVAGKATDRVVVNPRIALAMGKAIDPVVSRRIVTGRDKATDPVVNPRTDPMAARGKATALAAVGRMVGPLVGNLWPDRLRKPHHRAMADRAHLPP